ncbi:MAG: hypothetical protein IIC67_05990 [Thaumarchaeota archaeon]|nr:hypothetical protein [Nitrososphaerota archaeon]
MDREEIRFLILLVGILVTIVSLMTSYLYPSETEKCIIDAVLNDDMKQLEKCKNPIISLELSLMIGIIGIMLVGIAAVIKPKKH